MEQFTPSQKRVYDYFLRKVEAHGGYLIEGEGGTGKTYLADCLIQMFLRRGFGVIALAPTHVARQQLEAKLDKKVKVLTVAKFLSQFPQMDPESGRMVFSKGVNNGHAYHVVVVDEVSMIGEHEKLELMKGYPESVIIIMLGDFKQLKPIKKEQGNSHRKLENFVLLEQKRNSGSILALARAARNGVVFPIENSYEKQPDGKKECVVFVHENKQSFVNKYAELLEANRDTPFNVCFLAFRRATVASFRPIVREILYKTKKSFVEGQYLRLSQPTQFYTNGTIVRIERIVSQGWDRIGGMKMRVSNIVIKGLESRVPGEPISVVSYIRQEKIERRLEALYDAAKNSVNVDRETHSHIINSINHLRSITRISDPSARTVHMSQALSIPHVFIDTVDLSTGGAQAESLLYVAYSRAMKTLHTLKLHGLEPIKKYYTPKEFR